MSLSRLPILIDYSTGAVIRDFFSNVQTRLPDLKQSDTVGIDFMLVQPTRDINQPWRYLDLTDLSVRCALGQTGSNFKSGEMVFSYDGEESSPISYNSTPSAVESALNSISAIAAAGGVTVSGSIASPYKINFNTVGAKLEIGVDVSNFFPSANSQLIISNVGDAITKEIQIISFSVAPAAISEEFVDLEAVTPTVETLVAGDFSSNAIFRIDFSDTIPYAGFYKIEFDGVQSNKIEFDSSSAQIQEILVQHPLIGEGNIEVSGIFPVIDVEFTGIYANSFINPISVIGSGLKYPNGKRGELNLNVDGVTMLLADQPSTRAKLEFEIIRLDGTPLTPCQIDVVVVNDILSNSPSPSATPSINEKFVSYLPQSPTTEQQEQARQNLGLLGDFDYLPLAGGTMDDNATILWDNGSAIREAGDQGLEIECSVGYKWQWVAGRMILREVNSGQIKRILAIDAINPSATDDETQGFVVGTRWETVDGSIYICTDPTTGNALWLTLFDNTTGNVRWNDGDFIMDLSNKHLLDGINTSVDWGNRQLVDSTGEIVIDWEDYYHQPFFPYGLAVGASSIEMGGGAALKDGALTYSNNNVLSWQSGSLIFASGVNDSGGFLSIDTNTRQLIANDGFTVVAQWSNQYNFEANAIFGIGGSFGIDVANSKLIDGFAHTLDWSARTLHDGTGAPVARWGNINGIEFGGDGMGGFYHSITDQGINFAGNSWYDGNTIGYAGNTAIDVANRQLTNEAGTSIANWSNIYGVTGISLGDGQRYIGIDSTLRYYDGSAHVDMVDWAQGLLRKSVGGGVGATTLDWGNAQLLNGSGIVTVDWANTILKVDTSSRLDWYLCQLIGNDGLTVAVDWSSGIPVTPRVTITPNTVAALTGGEGTIAYVNDADTPITHGQPVTGGGTEKVLVCFDGTDWRVVSHLA